VAAEAAVGPVERHPEPVVLDAGDHPAAEQDQGEDPEAELVAGRRAGGLVDPQQPADAPLGARSQGEQGGDGAGTDQQGDGHVGG
jgi:hypothetical protein